MSYGSNPKGKGTGIKVIYTVAKGVFDCHRIEVYKMFNK